MTTQTDYLSFFQSIFADGTLSQNLSTEALWSRLKAREDFPVALVKFMVTEHEVLNALAPIEVLAGKRFMGEGERDTRVVASWLTGLGAAVTPTDADKRAHKKMLDYSLQERVIKVLFAVRDEYQPDYTPSFNNVRRMAGVNVG